MRMNKTSIHKAPSTAIIEIQTARLTLRQWRAEDRADFAVMNADPEVMRYFAKTLTTTESDQVAQRIESLIAAQGWGFWAVEKRDDNRFIGFVGLNRPDYPLPVESCVEIGWRLSKGQWGNGYATEAAKGALTVAFEKLNLPEVYAFTAPTNVKSQSVMQRLGMVNTHNNFAHPLVPAGHPLQEHVLYKIDRQTWLSTPRNP